MFATVKKALAGGIAAGLAALAQALADGMIEPAEWGIVAGAAIGGFVLVWATPKNSDKPGTGA